MMDGAQAEYARLSALVRLRLEELRAALDRHEEDGRWEETQVLECVEAGIVELAKELGPRPVTFEAEAS